MPRISKKAYKEAGKAAIKEAMQRPQPLLYDEPAYKIINAKCTDYLKKKIQANADKYAGGNLSRWLIWSALEFRPSFEQIKAKKTSQVS